MSHLLRRRVIRLPSCCRATRRPFMLPAGLVLCSVASSLSMAQDVEIIDNSPVELGDEAITANLVTLRPLTAAGFSTPTTLHDLRLTSQLIADSVSQFPEIRLELAHRNLAATDVRLSDWKGIIEASGYADSYLYDPDETQGWDMSHRLLYVKSEFATDPSLAFWNPVSVTNLLATGAIDVSNIETVNLEGEIIETAGFQMEFADKLSNVYRLNELVRSEPIMEAAQWHSSIMDEVQEDGTLSFALLQNVGRISFGQPVVYKAEEKDLVLPSSLKDAYDVCWVELITTFREINVGDLEEISVDFNLHEGNVALELIPLSFGLETTVTKELGSPTVEVEYQGAAVKVGEFFKKTVAYNSLKPTVVAFGLGESTFAWVLSDEAMRAGSHKFVAILGVPKGQGVLNLEMSGKIRLAKSLLWGGGGLASSETKSASLPVDC